jgi:glycogen(starch) synthase
MLDRYASHEGWTADRAQHAAALQQALAFESESNIWPSHDELRAASTRWGCADCNNCVVPNAFVGAPVGRVDPETRPFTFLAAGRFADRVKGADLLYRAFAELVRRHTTVRLEIASHDHRFVELLSAAPADSWTMLGWLDRADLLRRMHLADAVVVPSRYEPFGMVAIEAMAMGTPVIGMAVGGLTETIWHDVTGWLCPPEEGSLGLRLAMEAAAADRDATRAAGHLARAVIEDEYSLPRVARRVRGHLHNAMTLNGRLRFRALAASAPLVQRVPARPTAVARVVG